MEIPDINKKVFTPTEIEIIINSLKESESLKLIQKRKENNIYLLDSYCGTGNPISKKWNIKIYTYSVAKEGHSIVCNDLHTLSSLINKSFDLLKIDETKKVIKIDDAGWGFPLCGVMVGVTDEITLKTDIVPVKFFSCNHETHFKSGKYLIEYLRLAVNLFKEFNPTPETHRVEVCSGFINVKVKDELRSMGYDVRIVDITGMLQDQLELKFKEYIKQELSNDIYYDPKDMNKNDIPFEYYKALKFGLDHCPDKIKSGWDGISDGIAKIKNGKV